MAQNLSDLISDYTSSEHFLFLDSKLKEHAEPLLHYWADHVSEVANDASVEEILGRMARLDVPLEVRKAIPVLLREFFEYLIATGRAPQAAKWKDLVLLAEGNYVARFRQDGSVRGETFKKNYTDVGRNDPCPCGSGRKFKKCCMSLLS